MSTTPAFHFDGFSNPTTTPVPDIIFDQLLAVLKESELKALLYIVRRTFGFKKDKDPISFNQFIKGIKCRDGKVLDTGCGVKDRTTLSKALKSLEKMGIIQSEKGRDAKGENDTTVYSLHFQSQAQGVVGNSYHSSGQSLPLVVGISYPQETVLQQTEGEGLTGATELVLPEAAQAEVAQEPIWPVVLESLKARMTKTNHETWLAGTNLKSLGETEAVISAPEPYVTEWLNTRFRVIVEKEIADIVGRRISCKFITAH